jgi:glycosyltransferase involved in cell wall biosynthesis
VKILYVSHSAIPSREANSVQVMKMCAALGRAGHEVVLFARRGPEAAEPFGAYGIAPSFRLERFTRRGPPVLGRLLHSWRLAARLAREEAGLLYGRDFHTLLLLALRRGVRAPIVLEVHQPPRSRLEHLLQERLFAHPRFARLVCISRALADEYRRRFGDGLARFVCVAHDGADEPTSEPLPPRAPGAPFALGYVGHLYPGKGLELIERLAALLPECAFHVLGGQPEDVAAWRRRIAAPHVHFHGHLPHAEAQRRMRTFDALLAPYQAAVLIGGGGSDVSRWMSPLKVFEYMASGRPMVASDLPVLGEVLHDGENALLVPPDEPEAWARAVGRLLGDPAFAARLARRAREDLEQRYTWGRRAELVLEGLVPNAPALGVLAPSASGEA